MSFDFIQQKASGKINKTIMKNYTYNFHPTHTIESKIPIIFLQFSFHHLFYRSLFIREIGIKKSPKKVVNHRYMYFVKNCSLIYSIAK